MAACLNSSPSWSPLQATTTQERLRAFSMHAVDVLHSCGGMRGLMDMLSSRLAQTAEVAMRVLCCLVEGSEARKASVAAAGAIPHVVNLLHPRRPTAVRQSAALMPFLNLRPRA